MRGDSSNRVSCSVESIVFPVLNETLLLHMLLSIRWLSLLFSILLEFCHSKHILKYYREVLTKYRQDSITSKVFRADMIYI